jgi:hypothetical protein
MRFYCQFTWFSGTTREQVAQRLVEQHDAGANHLVRNDATWRMCVERRHSHGQVR